MPCPTSRLHRQDAVECFARVRSRPSVVRRAVPKGACVSSDQSGSSTVVVDEGDGDAAAKRPQNPYTTMLAILGGGIAMALVIIAVGFAVGGNGGDGGSIRCPGPGAAVGVRHQRQPRDRSRWHARGGQRRLPGAQPDHRGRWRHGGPRLGRVGEPDRRRPRRRVRRLLLHPRSPRGGHGGDPHRRRGRRGRCRCRHAGRQHLEQLERLVLPRTA